jgi:hypothetical protein
MMIRRISYILLLLPFLFLTSCKKDVAVVSTHSSPPLTTISTQTLNNNMIKNSTFESGGQSSLQWWTGHGFFSLTNDVPPDGGQWSLQLSPDFPSEGFAETYVTNCTGNNTFIFTCETKCNNWPGQIILRQKQNGITSDLSKLTFNNSTWSTVSLKVNASLNQSDTFVIHLSAGIADLVAGSVLFDNVNLQRQ